MMNTTLSIVADDAVGIEALRVRVAELEQVERKYQANLDELSEKEEFNFALFQYNPAQIVVVDRNGRVIKSNMAKKKAGCRLPDIGDVMYRDYASRHTVDMFSEMMAVMSNGITRRFPELPYDDVYLSVTIAPFPLGAIIISEDITERKNAERDRLALIADLRRALDEVETLRGLLPICASCKKIRDDKGYWNHIEVYISSHANVDFTHTLCPECIRHFYPDYWRKMQEQSNKHAEHAAVG